MPENGRWNLIRRLKVNVNRTSSEKKKICILILSSTEPVQHCSVCSARHCGSRISFTECLVTFFAVMVPLQEHCNWTLFVELST